MAQSSADDSDTATGASSTASTLVIAGEFTIATVADWHRQLVRLLRQGPGAALDLSKVSRCDIFAVQLLCALQRSTGRGEALRVTKAAPAVLEAAAGAGIPRHAILGDAA